MTEPVPNDELEAERLGPEESILGRRRTRDEEDYRAWCEAVYGMVELGEEVFHPADVLDRLAPVIARRGREDAAAQIRTDLERAVCEQFPAPIAIPFHGFLEGPRQPLTRLHRLRDTWESLIRLLAAMALSEATRIAALKPLILREGKDQPWRDCSRKDIFSDKLARRIGLVEGILHRASELGIELQLASLVPLDVLSEIRRLNVVRNGFSHESTKSDGQATEIIEEAYPLFRDVLLDLRDMQGIELLRIRGIEAGPKAEVERLNGHAQSRSIREITLDDDAAAVVLFATQVDGMARVLARVPGLTLDLSPFFYACDDTTGHWTRVLDFKYKKNSKWHLECVADSTTRTSPAAVHEALLVRIESLLGRSA